ncbi:hypothetical protein [Glaciihabitans arcticus]|uniref:hypothetical protein n=1 Tax=Glaciihabitans arcticus TaxID=2668039 RepID=UPI0012AC0248|nr:hypothetical protein [Glaciihabitans arcticus]
MKIVRKALAKGTARVLRAIIPATAHAANSSMVRCGTETAHPMRCGAKTSTEGI